MLANGSPYRPLVRVEDLKQNCVGQGNAAETILVASIETPARAVWESALRKLTFMPGTLQPVTERFVRKTGRPRHEWASQMNKEAMRIVGVHASLEEVLSDEQAWKQAVHRYCFS